ncbi:MAG: hypothetical protein LBJ90_03615, partial [Treponema sp.]|nr:hypothetical protein [Treponema sp.]
RKRLCSLTDSFIFFDDQPSLQEARSRRAGKAKGYKLINLDVFFTISKRPRYKAAHGGFGAPAVEDIPFLRKSGLIPRRTFGSSLLRGAHSAAAHLSK